MLYKKNFCRLNFKLVSVPLHFGVNLAFRDTDLRKHLILNISIKHLSMLRNQNMFHFMSVQYDKYIYYNQHYTHDWSG